MSEEHRDSDDMKSFAAYAKGTVVLHYEIIERIGAGGMGEVYLAEDTRLSRRVALKFLPSRFLADSDFRNRFTREARTAATLSHPNIVTIYEVNEHGGRPFIAMEYVEGRTLRDIIRERVLSPDELIDMALQICEGLKKAHQADIIHRDIKPTNIIIDSDSRPKILDFGLATIPGMEEPVRSGSAVGTVVYTSPEQTLGKKPDHRTDIWSLGVVLYEMITGRLPFRGEYEQAVIYSILNEDQPSITGINPEAPPGLERVINRALAKDPGERYQNAEEIMADLRELRKERETAVSTAQPSAAKPQPSIAVLPFTNLSADKGQVYFCDGMAEEIISGLTNVEGLRVVARTSAFAFRDKQLDIREIGRKLDVDTVLEGSVRKAGDRLRITVQLVNVADGYHLWSEKFDRVLEDIFFIQDEISLAIVEKLKVRVLREEKAKLVRRFTEDLDAYTLYLKGRYFWNRRYEGGLQQGLECFKQAIIKDTRYALAYAGIADSYNLLGLFGLLPPKEAYPRAKLAAEKALENDDTLVEAHASLAMIKMFFDHDWSGAEKGFKRAIQLNPNYATAREWYAIYLVVMERYNEALTESMHAQELDPLSLVKNAMVGWSFGFARQYDEAIKQLCKTLEMDPNFSLTYFFLGAAYAEKAMWKEAIATYRKLVPLTGESPYAVGFLGCVSAMGGMKDDALKALERLDELEKERYVSPFYRAVVYMGLSEKDRAFEYLDKAFLEKDSFMVFLKSWPLFDILRDDPRFLSLLEKMGLDK